MNDADHDAVVVGAGAGGAAAAWALASQGVRVLVLEAGPAFDPARDYRLHRDDWESAGFPEERVRHKAVYGFGPMQALAPAWDTLRSWNRGHGRLNPTGTRRGWKYHHVRGVGGSTLHFTGEAHRLNPAAMKMRSRFGVGADWPIDFAELEPYYERAEQLVGVAGRAQGSLRARRADYPFAAHAPSYASRRLMAADTDLHWEANSLAVLPQPYDGRPGCNYCAGCNHGCPRRDKGSADVSFMRRALATGRCTLLTEAPVLALEAGPRDRIESIDYLHAGAARRLRTRVLVLACGAVETPRLLLASAGAHAPRGVANESGEVGRNFLETLAWTSSGLHPENLGSYRGLPADIISWRYNAPDAIPGVIGGCRFSASAEGGLIGPAAYARRVCAGWGRSHKAAMRASYGHALTVSSIGESLPDAGSYIDLDPALQDAFGRPAARIHSHLADGELRRLAFMAQTCREALAAAGAGELVDEYGTYDFFSSTHVFGGCRMGARAEDSVVDASGRSHRWRNLYIADASVFPSSGGGESPSLTIEALAWRSGDAIRAALAAREI